MSLLNIFMNGYEQPENKLTYNFLCFLEHFSYRSELLTFLTDRKFEFRNNVVQNVKTVFGGGESNPDGLLELLDKNGQQVNLYFENKTFRRSLDLIQIARHIRNYCSNGNSFLLVITTRNSDKNLIKESTIIDKEKVFFKTWEQVASKIKNFLAFDTNNDFLLSQFLEYGEKSGEFESMDLAKSELIEYSKHITYLSTIGKKSENKILNILDKAVSNINYSEYGINYQSYQRKNHWGRLGCEIYFNPNNDYGQWMFIGIYYDSSDHGIKFINDEIELAFFFDITPKYKESLLTDESFKAAIEELTKNGFEENFINSISSNNWRFLISRIPISQISNFNQDYVNHFYKSILSSLTENKVFADKML